MAKSRRSARSRFPFRAMLFAGAIALVLFLLGEAWLLARSDRGTLDLARWTGLGDRARVTQIVGRQIRTALAAAGVPGDSLREVSAGPRRAPVRLKAGLTPDASLLQVHYTLHQMLDARGIAVLSGREHGGPHGESQVTLEIGIRDRPTHEITLSRPQRRLASDEPTSARLSLVLYGFGADADLAPGAFALPLPFAVALPPGLPSSAGLIKAARAAQREIVLHLPLEPINYPRVNPGPGTILVTMKPSRISSMVRRYLEQTGPVAAVANHMGSLATQDITVMGAVYRELRRQRLPFLHVTPAAGAVCKSLSADLGVDYDEPDAVIDSEARQEDARQLDARWKQVLEETRLTGRRVVMLRATPLVVKWLPGALEAKRVRGVSIVPLSSVLRRPAVL